MVTIVVFNSFLQEKVTNVAKKFLLIESLEGGEGKQPKKTHIL